LDDRELNQARSKPHQEDKPVRTTRAFVHHYNGTQHCSTETALLIFPFLQTKITSHVWPSRGRYKDSHNTSIALLATLEGARLIKCHNESVIGALVDCRRWVEDEKQTDEVDGVSEESCRRLRPVVRDGNTHVGQCRIVFEGVLDIGRHVDDVLNVVATQAGQIARRRRVAEVQVGQDLNRKHGDAAPLVIASPRTLWTRLTRAYWRGTQAEVRRGRRGRGQTKVGQAKDVSSRRVVVETK